jgi:hypothetical protein
MVNEHYVPRAYLRLFAPPNEGLISRYSLVEKHGGGDYYPPSDRYSIEKAASYEDFADGWLEQNHINEMENGLIEVLKKVRETSSLSRKDIAGISQFIAFQNDRTPESKLHYEARKLLGNLVDNDTGLDGITLDDGWESILTHNANEGHESLQHMGWLLVKNNTDTPFITSDRPVSQYLSLSFEEVSSATLQNEGREIYCPVDPETLLVLLDPVQYDLDGQYPDTQLEQINLDSEADVHEVNRLQAVTTFQEVFGPVDHGSYLEDLIQELCSEFPDEDYIRGNRADIETLQLAYTLASGSAHTPWYRNYGKPLIRAKQKKSHAIWEFDHEISFVKKKRRTTPNEGYWENLDS